jgi:hypothetical protein
VYKNGFAVNVLDYANNAERKKWSHVASGEFESGSVYTFEVTGKKRVGFGEDDVCGCYEVLCFCA